MSVIREPSNEEKFIYAYSFFRDVWINQNPHGTLFFLSWIIRMHKASCEDCRHYAREWK